MRTGFFTLLAFTLAGCFPVASLPRSASSVDFQSPKSGKTALWTYEDSMVFKGVDKQTAFQAAKQGLAKADFVVKEASLQDGMVLGYHGITWHDWYIHAGVYLQETAEGTNVKVIAYTSKDFSLVGQIGDTTSVSWPQLILGNMREFLARESRGATPIGSLQSNP